MRSSNSNYNSANALAVRNPVYAIEFSGITPKFVTAQFADYNSTDYKTYIRAIDFSLPGLDVSNGQMDAGRYSIAINDVDLEFSTIVFANSIFGLTVTCKAGFTSLNYSDFITLWQATVLRYRINTQGEWLIEAGNDLRALTAPTFLRLAKGSLGAALTDTATSLTIATTADGFIDPTTWLQMSEPGSVYAVQPGFLIGQELMVYSAINYGTRVASGLQRGAGRTTAIAHGLGEEITQVIAFFCDPLRAMLHIMTTTNATSTGSRNGDYDLGAPIIDASNNRLENLMLGIDDSLINVNKIERLGWKLFTPASEYDHPNSPNNPSLWVIGGVDNTLRFFEERILAPIGLCLLAGFAGVAQGGDSVGLVNNKIDILSLDRVDLDAQTAVHTFNDDNIAAEDGAESESLAWQVREDFCVNRVLYQFGHNAASGEFKSALELSVPEGITYYGGATFKKNIKHYGWRYDSIPLSPVYQTVNALNWRQMIFFDMPVELEFRTKGNCSRVEAGDIVEFDFTNFPNISTGAHTWSNMRGIVTAQSISVQAEEDVLTFRAILFDNIGYVYNDLSGFYTVNKLEEGDMSRNAATVDATFDVTVQLADAYFDNNGANFQTNRTIFFIRITPPNFGAGSTLEILRLGVGLTLAGVFESREIRYVRFNPQSATAFVIQVDLYSDALRTPDEAKLDFISTTATGSEIPTVELVGVWFCKPLTSFE